MKVLIKRLLIPQLLSVVLIFVSGWGLTTGQKAAALKFGGAASALGKVTAEEFTRSRLDVVEMRKMIKELDLEKADKPFDPDGVMDVDDVKARVQGAEVLTKYGDALTSLISISQTEQIGTATDGLLTNLGGVGISVSAQDKNAIKGAVQSVSGMFIEWKRKTAVKTVIPKMHGAVNQMLNLIEMSFATNGEWRRAYESTATDLRNVGEDLDATASGLAKAIALADTKEKRHKILVDKIIESVHKAREAHEDLIDVLKYEKMALESLDEFVKQIETLESYYKILAND